MTSPTAKIAGIAPSAPSPALQTLLKDAIARWRADGIKVAGLIEETHGLPDRTCNAGFLTEIGTGTRHSIYLEVPPSTTSCHLDAAGAEKAGDAVLLQIAASDLVVLSKFGKLEAAGGGLVNAFKAALAAGKPVLTTISSRHRAAWEAFAPTAATLPADAAALRDWFDAARQG